MQKLKMKPEARFDAVVKLLDAYQKLLVLAKAENPAVEDLGRIVQNLKRLPDLEREALLSGKRPAQAFAQKKNEEWSADKVVGMTLDDVLNAVRGADTSRAQLERIAALRFGMSKGALSPLPKDALIEKIRTLVEHEGTHESIARAAGVAPHLPPAQNVKLIGGGQDSLPLAGPEADAALVRDSDTSEDAKGARGGVPSA